jgi:hypothetical protein
MESNYWRIRMRRLPVGLALLSGNYPTVSYSPPGPYVYATLAIVAASFAIWLAWTVRRQGKSWRELLTNFKKWAWD